MKGSLAGACEDLVEGVSFWASLEIDLSEGVSLGVSTETDLSRASALGLRAERTCLEFLIASKGSSKDLDKNLE